MLALSINNATLRHKLKTTKAQLGNATGSSSGSINGGTTELEKQNLEAHVDLCSERYKGLHDRLSAIEIRLQKMNEDQQLSHKSSQKTIIATAGTVVAGLLSTVVVILMKMPG